MNDEDENERGVKAPKVERVDQAVADYSGRLTSITAWFFCVPGVYANKVPRAHWAKHERVVLFTLLVVLPLAALSWAHTTSLLVGRHAYAWVMELSCGVFMAVGVGIMDSMLAGALAERRFSVATLAVITFRQLFALCVAASLSVGAVLFLMEERIDRQRVDLALAEQQADQQRVRQIHDLDALQSTVATADQGVKAAEKLRDTPPTEVLQLKTQDARCQSERQALEVERSRRMPELAGLQAQLQGETAQAGGSPERSGKLTRVQSEIDELGSRIAIKSGECGRIAKDLRRAISRHDARVAKELSAATAARQTAQQQLATANQSAQQQLNTLRTVTDAAWDKNLGAQVNAAWYLVVHELWAALLAGFIFAVSLVIDLSPLLGKVALRGGPLDQITAVDDDAVRQELITTMAGNAELAEATRSAQHEYVKEMAEVSAIRRTTEVVMEEVELLHRRREAAMDSVPPEAREVVATVFGTALDKIRQLFGGRYARESKR